MKNGKGVNTLTILKIVFSLCMPFVLMSVALMSVVLVPAIGQAEKMDLETHNLVIGKLENTLKAFKEKDQNINQLGLKLQLANLYSEKARLLLVEEGNRNCQNCLQSEETRKKAISLYKVVRPQINDKDGGEVSLQLAHLLEGTNKKESLVIYNDLIRKKTTNKKVLARAYTKRANHFFKEGLFDKALADYRTILKISTPDQKGLTLHKMAWAVYNKGEVDQSIQMLLSILANESYLKQPTADGFKYSESFHSEVAHDLALFMAKTEITNASLNKLIQVTPPEEVVNNLLFLGDEAERVGQSTNAPKAWELALQSKDITDEKKMAVLLSIARHHRDNSRYTKATNYYGQSMALTKTATTKENAESQTKAFKFFLTQWEKQIQKLTKAKDIRDSQWSLIKAYEIFLTYNNTDYETYLWLGQLSHKLNKTDSSLKAFSRAADLIAENKDKKDDSTPEAKQKLLNEVLFTEVTIAESTSQASAKMAAYDHYLKLNASGPEASKVRYQRAKLIYDQNQVAQAFELFNEIVEDSKFKDADLKLKSAHLALDSLVLMKNVEKLEVKAKEYSQRFPKQAAQFQLISYNAGIQIVKNLASKDKSNSGAKEALSKLNSITLASNKPQDVKNHLKMKIDLAVRAQKWDIATSTLTTYLSRKDLSAADQTWGLTKKLSIAELLLDFKMAYQMVLKLNYDKSRDPKELLKGALLAELTQASVTPWLEKVIASPKSSREQSALARMQLVRLSRNPWKALRREAKGITSQPSLFASLALECFSREASTSEAEWALSVRGVRNTDDGRTLHRALTLKSLTREGQRAANMRLNSRTEALLSSSLQARMQALGQLKTHLQSAQRQQDWTLQVVAAYYLRNENQRLAQEISALPVPKNLKPKEKKRYQTELLLQANPFFKASTELNDFLAHSWANKTYIEVLLQEIDSKDRVRSVLMNELRGLAAVAPKETVQDIQNKLTELKNRPTPKDIASMQTELRKDPFDDALQNQLISMEKKRGNQSMVVFLQARGQSIKGGQL